MAIAAFAWLAHGCATEPAPATGALAVNLTASTSSGTVYRLRDATITVTNFVAPIVFHTEDDPSRTTLSADVEVGDYTASLDAGWRLERIEGNTATTVEAALISDNPLGFRVNANARTAVALRFRTTVDEVDFTQGYDLALDIDEIQPHGIVVANRPNNGPAQLLVFAPNARDDAAPRQLISGTSASLFNPIAVAVHGEEMFVLDKSLSAVLVYPRLVTGNVGPVRKIELPVIGFAQPFAIATTDTELFVSHNFGPILVYPIDGAGAIAPLRTLTVPNYARYFAIDHGELFVSDYDTNRVLVYSATATGDAAPIRVISSSALTSVNGVAVHDGELFVAPFYGDTICVFSATSSGNVAPLRTFGGASSGLQFTGQLSIAAGELFVANAASVRGFPLDATGEVAPRRILQGPASLGLATYSVAAY